MRFVPRFRHLVKTRIVWVNSLWRSSLRLRVVAVTGLVGIISLFSLGFVLSGQVRDGLFDERLQQVLADAALRAEAAQSRFDAATANSTQEVQQLANDTVSSLQETAGGTAAVVLLRSDNSTGPIHIVPAASDTTMRDVISPELRNRVVGEQFQQWQSVEVPHSQGAIPGVGVGSTVLLPGAGEHELYFIYSLEAEQQTLRMVQQALLIGGIGLVLALVLMTWYITRQVLDPVKRASRVAARLASGELSVRMGATGQDELALLGRSFNNMAQNLQDQIEQLAELSRMQQRFVSDVSHELRTPLTTIRMASEVLNDARESLDPSHRRSVELLQEQLDRFERLLADLLEISRIDAGVAELDTEPWDLVDVVDKVARLMKPIAAERGCELQVNVPAHEVVVEIDRPRIERIIRNLVINAIEHGEHNPVTIEVGVNDQGCAVAVEDRGVGMTPEEAQHVFDRFWRADPARARTLGGTGLGLAISYEDARLHGGDLRAMGHPGRGARFLLVLPKRIGMQITDSPLPLELGHTEASASPQPRNDDPAALPSLKEEI